MFKFKTGRWEYTVHQGSWAVEILLPIWQLDFFNISIRGNLVRNTGQNNCFPWSTYLTGSCKGWSLLGNSPFRLLDDKVVSAFRMLRNIVLLWEKITIEQIQTISWSFGEAEEKGFKKQLMLHVLSTLVPGHLHLLLLSRRNDIIRSLPPSYTRIWMGT